MIDILTENLIALWQDVIEIAPKILMSLFVLILFIWIGRLLARGVAGVLLHSAKSKTIVQFVKQLTIWLVSLLGVIPALNILGLGPVAVSLMAGGGLVAVVFGFAFREVGENFIAGFFLTFSRSFEVGDYIESEGLKGDVKTIELRHVHIRTPDGCDIFIPSAQIFKSPLFNYTRDGLRRPSFVVGIDYADDPGEAVDVLLAATNNTVGVLKDPRAIVVISALQPLYVELQVNFWVNTFEPGLTLLEIQNHVIENCCRALKNEKFTFSSDCSSNLNLSAGSTFRITHDS
ncbi:Small-conductance mechanosensitive channel [Malonomonas rubra DSM 5091]|uniref:Small-conductance mechanosensitive channel n=1 Tax=Malonomonas rubra DSM 5091 TaxID=1122189 RepID=A0A1M6KQN4_MALRU|nr:mechanosensitive ion channel domain-containing protein [Malonomonas rubra]SHJ61249.1 Small-conductance mechanosensitive channel [Malonomonas rubra DSM 5091]